MAFTIILTANRGYALTSSRSGLIRHFLNNGWRVVLATANDAESENLRTLGAILEPISFNRGGLALGMDIKAYRRLAAIYQYYQPELIHHFHAKPVILGSIAARRVLGRSARVVNTITGLGHAFTANGITAKLAGLGYRWSLSGSDATIFQNRDDHQLFLDNQWVSWSNSRLIVGSGINVNYFTPDLRTRAGRQPPVVIMLGRLLKQKGIHEFIDVAARIRRKWPDARFVWAGEEDKGHADGVSAEWMRTQHDIEYAGRLSDVAELLRDADLFLFPSFYREGVPRAIMEAAASGLPTVGFDVPGVREAVIDGQTGYLLPAKDSEAMANRVAELLEDSDKRLKMGDEARALAVEAFDRKAIEEQHLALYRELGVSI